LLNIITCFTLPVLCEASHKVAKTTTVCNLGHALTNIGYKVLLIDFDPQANLTMSMGIGSPDELEMAMSDMLAAVMAEDEEHPEWADFIRNENGIDIIPSNLKLADTEMHLRDDVGGQLALKNLIDPLRDEYQYIIIDTNPYLGLLTINAIAACDEVIVCASPQLWSATGLGDLMGVIGKIKRKLNRGVSVKGILFTMCDERTKLYSAAIKLVEEHYKGTQVFSARIPLTVKMGEANYNSTSIFQHSPDSKAAKAYMEFAKEVVA